MNRVKRLLSIAVLFSAAGMCAPILDIQPATNNLTVGQTFSLDVRITNAIDLYGYQFDLGFNPAVLAVSLVSEGPFLATGGATSFFPGSIDNAGGTIAFNGGILNTALAGVSGSGVLATVSFTAIGAGSSSVGIFNTFVIDSFGEGIIVTASSGQVSVTSVPEPSSLLLGASGIAFLAAVRKHLGPHGRIRF